MVAGLLALGVLAWLLPNTQARAKALVVLAASLDRGVPRPFAPEVIRAELALAGVDGHLYAPEGALAGVLLVPGATPQGLDDPRIVQVAEALARSGRRVFLPELSLYERRFDEADIERLVLAGRALADEGDGTVVLAGFSYGGALTLIAAADPRLRDAVATVAVFGAYHDLVGVIQAAATGASVVGERRMGWDAHPRAEELLHAYAVDLAPAEQREALSVALDGVITPDGLDEAARAVYDLVTAEHPEEVRGLVEALSPQARATIAAFSPSAVAGDIPGPIVALHSIDDPAVPYAEALRLIRDRPDVELLTVALFDHVDLRPDGPGDLVEVLRDARRTWRFAARVLEPHE